MSINNNTRRTVRCCSKCGETGHNIRTCPRDIFDIFQNHSALQSEEDDTDIRIRSMEYGLRREMILFTMSNILTDFITMQDNANSKLNALCNVNNNENEDIITVVLHLGVNYAGKRFELEHCGYNEATFPKTITINAQ